MQTGELQNSPNHRRWAAAVIILITGLALVTGCGTVKQGKRDGFFTSGSREADQRASQTMAKHEQLAGEGEGAGEKEKKKDKDSDAKGAAPGAVKVEEKQPLFERLGGNVGLSNIVADFLPRALNDPRVNWDRSGVQGQREWFGFKQTKATQWQPTQQNLANLANHMVQFLALATGGPAQYQGKEMKNVHANMRITNPEFDAVIGDMKATLDRLQIANREQKELLAILESTRPQVVTVR